MLQLVLFLGFGTTVWQYGKRDAAASILAVAPHIGMLEAASVILLNHAMPVSNLDNLKFPFVGAVTAACKAIFVDKADPESRTTTVTQIRTRARTPEWQATGPVLIFPEGTTHSQRALLEFKTGAYRPALPVQPIVVRMPWRFHDPCWVSSGPGMGELILRTMCQFYNVVELHYLGVHVPSENERADAKFFATNSDASVDCASSSNS